MPASIGEINAAVSKMSDETRNALTYLRTAQQKLQSVGAAATEMMQGTSQSGVIEACGLVHQAVSAVDDAVKQTLTTQSSLTTYTGSL